MHTETNQCLFNGAKNKKETKCEDSTPGKKRLCACFNPGKIVIYQQEWDAMISNAQKQAAEPYLEQ
jgi:hypothetical protein